MNRRFSFVAFLLLLSLVAGCASQASAPDAGASVSSSAPAADSSEETPDETTQEEPAPSDAVRGVTGLYGEELLVPATVDTIISLAPSTTELLTDLGLSEKIVAVDTYSAADYADILPAGIPAFDMMNPDNEQIVALNADIVFTTGMSYAWGEDVFASAREAGVFIIDIESPSSLQEIIDSIVFIGDCAGERATAEEIAQEMEAFLSAVHTVMDTTDFEHRRTILFELSSPTPDYPMIYSVGPGSYIDEILSLTGGDNIASGADSPWPALDEEWAVAQDPEVILTTEDYIPDIVDVLLSLPGWEGVTAIQNGDVYLIDGNRINRPNHRVCGAILEIGLILYPGLFEDIADPFADEALPNAA
ncbi:MAG: ABC transporter substrate-binding protein [Lachnospiraceae bacterium]|nr:ABC transporter substrate-binding protein [Lachnospiraceae bacterium]